MASTPIGTDASKAEVVLAGLAGCETREEQISCLQQSWLASSMSEREAQELLGRLARARNKQGQIEVLQYADVERQTIAALDSAVAPIIMQPPSLRLVIKTTRRMVEHCDPSPERLAKCLNELEVRSRAPRGPNARAAFCRCCLQSPTRLALCRRVAS